MKLFFYAKLTALILLLSSRLFAAIEDKSAVIYYGDEISYPKVGIHDYIIVEPKNLELYTTGFKKYKSQMYAYISVNEMIKEGPYNKDIQKKWIIGDNKAWASYVMNITDISYQNYLLKRIQKLKNDGYENFFFDTMDSYQLTPTTKEEREQLRLGLIQFIKRVHHKFPQSKLIINRGFEIIDEVHDAIEALLFESYYKGMNASTMQYRDVSAKDREWLDIQLQKVKSYHIPIIALDYIPLDKQEEIHKDIQALKAKGFIPYVSEKSLNYIGYSSKNAFNREVLIIYNGHHLEDDIITSSNAHLFASTPLEYMGYIPILKDSNKALPHYTSNRYAGIIVWLDNPDTDRKRLLAWAKEAILEGSKVLFLGDNSLPLLAPLTKELGLNISKNSAIKGKNTIIYRDPMMHYETKAIIKKQKYMIDLVKDQRPYLTFENAAKKRSTVAAKTSWGGYVRDVALLSDFFGDNAMWVIDPFKLFRDTLELSSMPVPDPTTENGKRLAFLHVDGDGSMNKVEHDTSIFSIELIERDFIRKYHFPQSISIVESETAPYGKYPQYSKRLEAAARRIYAQPYVEAATHTFTHPYFWQALEKDPSNEHYRTHWKIDYTFTPKREILDSLDYINTRLLPAGKKGGKTIFWSGDCFPSANIIKYCYQHGITNINGGDTTITNDKPWLQLVQPFGIKYGNYYQVYTGQQNENVYTDDWRGPFWGFKKVIQTFNLTENPRRLKPIDIYYHFYSASKTAAYEALKEVYDWVLTQDVMHIYTSAYPPKVTDFYDASLYHDRGRWLLKGFHNLRTVRIPQRMGFPSIKNSIGVVGYKAKGVDYYIHLDEKKSKILTLQSSPAKSSYLITSNARLKDKRGNRYHFYAQMPANMTFHIPKGCTITTPQKVKKIQKALQIKLNFENKGDIYVQTTCN